MNAPYFVNTKRFQILYKTLRRAFFNLILFFKFSLKLTFFIFCQSKIKNAYFKRNQKNIFYWFVKCCVNTVFTIDNWYYSKKLTLSFFKSIVFQSMPLSKNKKMIKICKLTHRTSNRKFVHLLPWAFRKFFAPA